MLPEGSFGVGVRGHVAFSKDKSEGSLVVAFGTRGGLRRLFRRRIRGGAFGVAFGTRGVLRRAPKGVFWGGMFRGGALGVDLVVVLGINGWDGRDLPGR